jgi:hypothetical protein
MNFQTIGHQTGPGKNSEVKNQLSETRTSPEELDKNSEAITQALKTVKMIGGQKNRD